MEHRLTRQEARRIAVRAQLLDAPRPTDLLEVVRHLAVVQVDLTTAVAPSADLVCWARLGSAHEPSDLDDLLDDGSLVEFQGVLRPAEDMALFRADMATWPGPEPLTDWQRALRRWMGDNEACRQDILQVLRADGPLRARDLPDTCLVPWRSSGWNDGRNVQRMLDLMERRGEVAVSSREGRERLWDLAGRVYPDHEVVPLQKAHLTLDERRLRSFGIARSRGSQQPVEAVDVGAAGEPATIEGVRGTWRVHPDQLDRPFEGRAALLSPLDRLVIDRKRLADVFEFDYQLEMYKPAVKRRWGYWAMPILYGDRFVGKLDATADHQAGLLRVHAVHEDVPFTKAMRSAVEQEIRDLAQWLELETRVES
jgi:hypothetical protein